MDSLEEAVRAHASRYANRDGVALTPVPGLIVKCVEAPRDALHSTCRPVLILVLQGAKHITVGREELVLAAGQSAIVSADMPMMSRVLQASQSKPYMAVGVELEMASLREVAAQLGTTRPRRASPASPLFATDTERAALDCVSRLMRLIDSPDAIELLRPGIMKELNYWLLTGQRGEALCELCDRASYASRLASAIAIIRAEYRARIPTARLAAAAGLSLTAFHKHFKHMTSLTPGQYQKRLRLIEARRLMLDEGASASSAAFEVGYESPSQFTREYGRLFQTSPKRDVLRFRSRLSGEEDTQKIETERAKLSERRRAPIV